MLDYSVRIHSTAFLRERKVVANAESLLEEQGSSQADNFALIHDAYSVTEHIGFVHVMGRKNDNSAISVSF